MKRNGLLVVMTEQLRLYRPTSKTYHSIIGDTYVKELTWKLNDEWIERYKHIQAYEPRIIEIYDVVNYDTIWMKRLNGESLDIFITENYYLQYCEIVSNIYKYNRDKKIKFYHRDAQFQNFIADEGVVYLIDPDSFHLYKKGTRGKISLRGGWK